ncbi:MAG TPA: hypothetical protein ENH99_01150 [Candidatus Pacearchaeota archaeon]|nr:hypothetical protein [Candidatus Pacearchaeota archaeon]
MKKRSLNLAERRSVEENYGLKTINSFPFGGGMRSNTVFIETNHGPRVAKIYPQNYSPKVAEFQAEVCNYLHSNGTPTPRIHRNLSGNLVTSEEDRNYVLMDFLRGAYPSRADEGVMELTFGTLANVLKTLSGFDTSGGVFEIPEIEIPLGDQLRVLEERVESGDHVIGSDFLKYLERIREIYEQYERDHGEADFPRQLVLGDFNLESLLVYDGRVSGILDFDQVRFYGKGFDFMHSFDNLCIDKETPGLELEERVDWEKLREAMSFYARKDRDIASQFPFFPLMHQDLGLRSLITTFNEVLSGDLPPEYLYKMGEVYMRRVEIPTRLGQRIIEVLGESLED